MQKAYNNFNRTLDRNPSPRTRRHVHRILKSALARAVEQQALPRNPADALKRLPKVEVEPITVLTVEQSKHLLKTISHTTTYWPTLIALSTGMRRGEVLALRWKNVDLEQGTVRVVESLEETKAGILFKSTKTDKGRAVLLPKFASACFEAGSASKLGELLRLGVRQRQEGLVCAREDGEPKRPASLTNEFTYLVSQEGLAEVRFHDLRHSHAHPILAAGVHPRSFRSA
jgi:integrase